MADQPRLPLWRVMDATVGSRTTDDLHESPGADYAAEIRALADWLVPERACPEGGDLSQQLWVKEMALRDRLLFEADRAEAGE